MYTFLFLMLFIHPPTALSWQLTGFVIFIAAARARPRARASEAAGVHSHAFARAVDDSIHAGT